MIPGLNGIETRLDRWRRRRASSATASGACSALRFVHDLTQTEIAEQIGVSQMQISRILRRSIARLGELADADSQAATP